MSNRWFTMEDILNDLTEVTGGRVTNIDDRFAVSGERPPPVHVPDVDDNEFIEMYGQCGGGNNKMAEPDLAGIQHMLRMVYDYYDTATFDDNENIKELKKVANTVINISKLDPNVTSFVPKNETINVADNEETNESSDYLESMGCNSKCSYVSRLVGKDDNEIHKTDVSHKNEANDNDIDVTKKIDVSSLNSNEIKDIREKLKLKIVDTYNAECLKKKRDRNLAMASLLKLYTDIPKSPRKSPPLKLMTPEYFQTLPENVSNGSVTVTAEHSVINEEVTQKNVDANIKTVRDTNNVANGSSSSPITTSQKSIGLSNKAGADLEPQKNNLLMSKEVEQSVKKVDEWLNGPEKKKHKTRAIYMGPVTFKRKDTASLTSSESPSLQMIDNIERPSSAQTSDCFVPSSYANELSKSYMERNQSKAAQHEDMWTKLERQLQEKDKMIKEKLLSTQAQM